MLFLLLSDRDADILKLALEVAADSYAASGVALDHCDLPKMANACQDAAAECDRLRDAVSMAGWDD